MPSINYTLDLGLNDIPDDSIEPAVWAEMQKLFTATKMIAAAMDSGVHPGILGTPGAAITVQNYSKVFRSLSVAVAAGTVIQFSGTLTAPVSAADPIPSAITEVDIPANTRGEFILLGAVYYPPGGLVTGVRYYVDTGAGKVGKITTSTAGRYVGIALAPAVLYFNPTAW